MAHVLRRSLTTRVKKLTIGLIPADGIGREVIPVNIREDSNKHIIFNKLNFYIKY
jgi:hypothetical protein